MPDPANPQSLNRFSWVLGNPLKYIDPSGHDEQWVWRNRWYNAHGWYWNSSTGHWDVAGDPHFSDPDILDEVARKDSEVLGSVGPENLGFHLTKNERRQRLSQYALHLSDSGLNSVEILARIVEYAAVFHSDSGIFVRPFVDDVSSVLVGHTGLFAWLSVLGRDSPGPHLVEARHFDQSGLAPWYQDATGIGQLHHFWFYVHLTVNNGPVFAEATNLYHDPPWVGNPGHGGVSLNDHFSGMAGIVLGHVLSCRLRSISSVGQWIRTNLSSY